MRKPATMINISAFALAFGIASVAGASTIYVSPSGSDSSGDGSSGNPYALPTTAISPAAAGDEVVLKQGTYTGLSRIGCAKDITIRGETDDPRATVLNFEGQAFSSGSVALAAGCIRDLTISNAAACGLYLKENVRFASNVVVTACSYADANWTAGVQLAAGGLYDCVVTRNKSAYHYGGVCMSGSSTFIKGGEVTFNEATAESAGGVGTGSWSAQRLEGVKIAYNTARWAGGVLNIHDIVDCEIFCNTSGVTATSGSLGVGIVINKSESPVVVSNCVIHSNYHPSSVGGLAFYNTESTSVLLDHCVISNHVSSADSAALYNSSGVGDFTLKDCDVSYNQSSSQAGVLLMSKGNLQCSGCNFVSNSAVSRCGAFYTSQAYGVFSNCVFYGCSSSDGPGGAVGAYASSTNVFYDCVFTGNSAYDYGGAVVSAVQPARTEIYSCVFSNNVSGTRGGAVSTPEWYCLMELVIRDCIFRGNHSAAGGAVAVRTAEGDSDTADITIRNSLFEGNYGTGAECGGGLYLASHAAVVENCTFVKNYTMAENGNGGGVYHRWGGILRNCAIVSNYCNTVDVETGSYWCNKQVRSGASSVADSCINTIVWPTSSAIQTVFTEANGCKVPSSDNIFEDIAGGDYRPSVGSPLFGGGVNLSWMEGACDLGGRDRIIGDNVDIGCYERYPFGFLLIVQ